MVRELLDGNGRLREFSAVPGGNEIPASQPRFPPRMCFTPRGWIPRPLRKRSPPCFPPRRSIGGMAWKGPHPVIPNTEVTVDAAWWKGRVVRVYLSLPYMGRKAGDVVSSFTRFIQGGSQVLLWIGAFLVLLLASRNWRTQRADRQGAGRIAAASFLLGGVAWAGKVHAASFGDMVQFGLSATADALLRRSDLGHHVPGARTRRARSLAALHRHLEPRAGRPLDGRACGVGHPARHRRGGRPVGRCSKDFAW